jgi:hypothetical protein
MTHERHAASEPRRLNEWFVPQVGPTRFRVAVGLLFLPYTGMVLAFTAIGAMLAETVHWDRVLALAIVYFLALGIGAHALDAIGGDSAKPWGTVFSKRQLWTVAAASVTLAYAIGLYYILTVAPWLAVIALLEGFFLLAYNLEWFEGRFHSDGWFAFSWGMLPVLAGYVLQTNTLSIGVVIVAAAMGAFAFVEISASRPYKALRRAQLDATSHGHGPHPDASLEARWHMARFEAVLKSISIGVMLLAAGMMVWRGMGYT